MILISITLLMWCTLDSKAQIFGHCISPPSKMDLTTVTIEKHLHNNASNSRL